MARVQAPARPKHRRLEPADEHERGFAPQIVFGDRGNEDSVGGSMATVGEGEVVRFDADGNLVAEGQ